jgi:hypothetical protein
VQANFKVSGVLKPFFGEVEKVNGKSYRIRFDDGDVRTYYEKDWKELTLI